MVKFLGTLASGEQVYDRHRSHIHKGVAPLLSVALARINAEDRTFLIEEVDFSQPIGETTCVETTRDSGNDKIVYARRPRRHGLTRFVKNREAEPCSAVTVILKRDDFKDYYVLITAFVGHKPEPEPWDRNATPQSRAFWETHALVWVTEPVESGITFRCPW